MKDINNKTSGDRNEHDVSKDQKKNDTHFDDGRTIANMNVEGFNWYIPEKHKKQKKELAGISVTKEERRAMIKGALLAILPVAFAFIGIFLAIFLMIYFWLT